MFNGMVMLNTCTIVRGVGIAGSELKQSATPQDCKAGKQEQRFSAVV